MTEDEKEKYCVLGHHVFLPSSTSLSWPEENTKLFIGNYTTLSHHVNIFLGGTHRWNRVSLYPLLEYGNIPHSYSNGNVVIGSDVSIGWNATILSGIHIGHGAYVGARSLVSRNVPPYGIVAGNPAQLIRRRFSDEVIERLLDIAWWNWSEEKIKRFYPFLAGSKIIEFLELAEEER